jgi:hypothetical protein
LWKIKFEQMLFEYLLGYGDLIFRGTFCEHREFPKLIGSRFRVQGSKVTTIRHSSL